MLFKNITVLDENFNIRENAFVTVEGERITGIYDEMPQGDKGRVYDGRGKLLMPGFYNAHAHSPMSLMRGYGENLALQDWLNKRIFPFEDKLDGNAVYWGTLLSYAESIRFGIVSSTEMYYFMEEMAQAVSDSGTKANLSRAVTYFGDGEVWELAAMKEMESAFRSYHQSAGGRIKIDASIHAEYTSTRPAVEAVAAFAKENGLNMHVHLSETKSEHEECKGRHDGMTPAQYFNDAGVFEVPTTAAHCVWVEDGDMDILKEKGVTVAVNPASNMKLASGVCNVQALLDKGVGVAIGTDSTASNNSLNYIEEMKLFCIGPKARYGDPTAVSPAAALRAGTLAGARSQGRADCGLVREGARADLIVLDISGPHMHPVHDLRNNLVYSASGSDVVLTMADGKILYENGEYTTIDIEKTVFEAEKATKAILAAL